MAAALIVAARLLPGCSAKDGRAPAVVTVESGAGSAGHVPAAGSPTGAASAAKVAGSRRSAAASGSAPSGSAPSRGADGAPQPQEAQVAGANRGGIDLATGLPAPSQAPANGGSASVAREAGRGNGAGGNTAPGMESAVQGRGATSTDAVFVAALQSDLAKERARNQRLERDLQQLREETTSGPFETGLEKSRRQIAELQDQLEKERQTREKLARDFDDLRRNSRYANSGDAEQLRAELAALKQEQQEAIASVESELAASQARERDLTAKLAIALDSPTNPPFEKIADLTKENLALRTRLDEEHRRNTDLATKLATAQRVTDLIFKMQGARAGAAANELPAATRPAAAPAAVVPAPPRAVQRPIADAPADDPPAARRVIEPAAAAAELEEEPVAPPATRTPRPTREAPVATATLRHSPPPTRTPTIRPAPSPQPTLEKPRRAVGQQMT